jgi:hypothetical protein
VQRPLLGHPRRAAVISACGHAALAALVLLTAGVGSGPTASRGPIIAAELVTLAPPRPAEVAPVEPAANDEPTRAPPAPAPDVTPTQAPKRAAPPPPAPAPEPVDHDIEATREAPPLEPVPRAAEAAPPAPAEPVIDAAEKTPIDEITPPVAATAGEEQPAVPAQQPIDAEAEKLFGRRLASWTGRFEPGEPAPTMHWRQDGQHYTAVLRKLPNSDVMGMEHLAVDVTTERDGQRLMTQLRMTRLAFSNFAQFVDQWDPGVQIHDDEIDGRFHSNSEIRVSGLGRVQPVFRGKVTVAAGDVQSDGPLSFRRTFPAGIETRARRIPLPTRGTALDELALREDRVQRFVHDAIVTFYADGSYGWRDGEGGPELGRRTLSNDPYYLIGAEDVTLYVSGTVNGTVLVYTPDRIVITDDLVYAADPRAPDADDYLGLVADRTVEIGGPEFTGPGDLEVHASIYARYEFAVRNYRSRPSGTLLIFGSVTAGSVTATEPRFATKIEFDPRLTTMRAPGFPLSDRYEIESWSGEWHDAPTSVAGNSDEAD